jgi:outer membrane lipoprotein-sorting protein
MILIQGICLAFLAAASAHASPGDDYLAQVDKRANAPTDTWFSFKATTQEPGKALREMAFEVQNKGEKRMVRFTAPSDMKGTRVLVLSRQQMWVYLPAYRKVRRVASHVKQQGFMGTTYSDEDMSTTQFGGVFTAAVVSESEVDVQLRLSPRAGAESGYAHAEMVVRKDIMLPSEIRYFNEAGQHLKTETRSEYDCANELCTPRKMKMTDHARGDAWTVLDAVSRRVNQGVSDSKFTVRNLERGR